jgi:hypothetical protein
MVCDLLDDVVGLAAGTRSSRLGLVDELALVLTLLVALCFLLVVVRSIVVVG